MFALDMVVIAMLAAQAPTAPVAGETPGPRVVVTGPERPPSQRRICRLLPQTSSRIGPPRVCHTQAEWDEELRLRQAEVGETVDNLHDRLDQEAPRRENPAFTPR